MLMKKKIKDIEGFPDENIFQNNLVDLICYNITKRQLLIKIQTFATSAS